MFKPIKLLITIVIILVALPVAALLFNKICNLFYNPSYTEAHDGASSTSYVLVKINVPGKEFNYHLSQAATNRETHDGPQASATEGYLCYDTVKQQLLIQTTEYVPPTVAGEDYDRLVHYVNINLEGNITADNKGLYLADDTAWQHCIVLKDKVTPFYHWTNKRQDIYLQHFSMDHFNTNCLNPLRGIGNPTGSSRCYWWSGMGYYGIRMNGELLKVKIPARRPSLFFPGAYEYDTRLSFYQLPPAVHSPEVAFIVYTPRLGPHEFYLIKKR